MADLERLKVVIEADASKFKSGMMQAKTGMVGLNNQVKTSHGMLLRYKIAMLAVAGVMIKATKDAMEFNKQMAMVSTMLSGPALQGMEIFKRSVLDMSVKFGQSTQTLSKGLYDVLSAQIEVSKSTEVLAASAKLAVAGFTDVATANKAVISVLKGYHMNASRATEVSDILFSTVEKGILTFDELATSIGTVAPLAAQVGVSFEELGAAIATATGVGMTAHEVSTGLRSMFTNILKGGSASEEAEAAYADLGFRIDTTAVKTEGFSSILKKLNEMMRLNGDAFNAQLAAMIPNQRALKIIIPIISDLAGYEKSLAANTDSAGKSLTAFEKVAKEAAFQTEQIKQQFNEWSVALGNEFLPVWSETLYKLRHFTDLTRSWRGLPPIFDVDQLSEADVAFKKMFDQATESEKQLASYLDSSGKSMVDRIQLSNLVGKRLTEEATKQSMLNRTIEQRQSLVDKELNKQKDVAKQNESNRKLNIIYFEREMEEKKKAREDYDKFMEEKEQNWKDYLLRIRAQQRKDEEEHNKELLKIEKDRLREVEKEQEKHLRELARANQEAAQEMATQWNEFNNIFKQSFSSAFSGVLTGELNTFKDFFKKFLTDIRQASANWASGLVSELIFGSASANNGQVSTTGLLSGGLGGIVSSIFGGGAATTGSGGTVSGTGTGGKSAVTSIWESILNFIGLGSGSKSSGASRDVTAAVTEGWENYFESIASSVSDSVSTSSGPTNTVGFVESMIQDSLGTTFSGNTNLSSSLLSGATVSQSGLDYFTSNEFFGTHIPSISELISSSMPSASISNPSGTYLSDLARNEAIVQDFISSGGHGDSSALGTIIGSSNSVSEVASSNLSDMAGDFSKMQDTFARGMGDSTINPDIMSNAVSQGFTQAVTVDIAKATPGIDAAIAGGVSPTLANSIGEQNWSSMWDTVGGMNKDQATMLSDLSSKASHRIQGSGTIISSDQVEGLVNKNYEKLTNTLGAENISQEQMTQALQELTNNSLRNLNTAVTTGASNFRNMSGAATGAISNMGGFGTSLGSMSSNLGNAGGLLNTFSSSISGSMGALTSFSGALSSITFGGSSGGGGFSSLLGSAGGLLGGLMGGGSSGGGGFSTSLSGFGGIGYSSGGDYGFGGGSYTDFGSGFGDFSDITMGGFSGIGWSGGFSGFATGTPYVPQDGMYKLHQGEEVVPPHKAGTGVTIINIVSPDLIGETLAQYPNYVINPLTSEILTNGSIRKTIQTAASGN